jgi:hypothetical protein
MPPFDHAEECPSSISKVAVFRVGNQTVPQLKYSSLKITAVRGVKHIFSCFFFIFVGWG